MFIYQYFLIIFINIQRLLQGGGMSKNLNKSVVLKNRPIGLPSESDFEIKTREELQLISIRCCVKISGKTGVEMEALTGATVAALTIYDMCKAITHNMVIKEARLIEKSGGKRNVKEGSI